MDKEKKVRSAVNFEIELNLLAEDYARNVMKALNDNSVFTVSRSDIMEHHIADFKAGYYAASQLTPSSREEEQWISVEERLPEDIDVVLVWSTTSIKPTVAYYFQNDWLYHSINNGQFWLKEETHIQITHWMPLPSPPKKVTPK